MSVSYGGDSVTFADNSTITSGWTGFKNRVINGEMKIDQRNNGSSVSITSAYGYPVDRFRCYNSAATARWSAQRVTDAPSGFEYSAKITVTTAQSSYGDNELSQLLEHPIEGFNVSDLDWGTASAKPVTVSFWVKSSLTGSFPFSVFTLLTEGSYATYLATYTINQANTWEYKTITVPGATIGTWGSVNNVGLFICFTGKSGTTNEGTLGWQTGFKCGKSDTVNLFATNGATWQVTGVQLERGSTASSFEYRPYGTELTLCQRYYEVIDYVYMMLPWNSGTQIIRGFLSYKVQKRAAPTFTYGTKLEGTGTLGVSSGGVNGIVLTAGGSQTDVIGYSNSTVSSEL